LLLAHISLSYDVLVEQGYQTWDAWTSRDTFACRKAYIYGQQQKGKR